MNTQYKNPFDVPLGEVLKNFKIKYILLFILLAAHSLVLGHYYYLYSNSFWGAIVPTVTIIWMLFVDFGHMKNPTIKSKNDFIVIEIINIVAMLVIMGLTVNETWNHPLHELFNGGALRGFIKNELIKELIIEFFWILVVVALKWRILISSTVSVENDITPPMTVVNKVEPTPTQQPQIAVQT